MLRLRVDTQVLVVGHQDCIYGRRLDVGWFVWARVSGETHAITTATMPYLRACATITAIYGISHTRACIL